MMPISMLRAAARGFLAGCACLALVLAAAAAGAQPRAAVPLSPRAGAAIDLTGYWVSIVNEDWRWRMRTPPKGDYASVQTLNPRGRAVADQWQPEQDGSCKAYGAGGLLRMPTRLHITWQNDETLEIETDAGSQTRLLHFDASRPNGPPSLQGHSTAAWRRTLPPPGRMGFNPPPGAGPPTVGGSLTVTTTNLSEGWLRRNGVPYSDQTTLTEHFDRFAAPNGDEWLVVTTIVQDPVYHFDRYITSTHFRREPNDAKWHPTTCRND
jgi:hypothetical protein